MELISRHYRKMNQKLHKSPRGFGASGHRWVTQIHTVIHMLDLRSILDYGCGQETFWTKFRDCYPIVAQDISYVGYDPAVSKKDSLPHGKFDLIICTDVLEHIEPEYLINVIEHLFSFARRAVFFNIAICPANKRLSDGRNAHLIVKSGEWWINQISAVVINGWNVNVAETAKRWKDVNIWATAKEVCPC